MFIVEVAVNLWSPHYCRFSLSLSLPRIRVACASGSPPVPAPFRRLLSSDFPLFRRFSSCLKSIHGFFFLFLFFIMDPLAHDQTSHVESRTSQRIERKKDRSRLGNWNVVSSLLETILSQKKKKERKKESSGLGQASWRDHDSKKNQESDVTGRFSRESSWKRAVSNGINSTDGVLRTSSLVNARIEFIRDDTSLLQWKIWKLWISLYEVKLIYNKTLVS